MAWDSRRLGKWGRIRSSMVTVARELKAEEMVLEAETTQLRAPVTPGGQQGPAPATLPQGPPHSPQGAAEEAGNEEAGQAR